MGRIQAVDPAVLNPCNKEQDITYKCLSDHGYDRDKCLKAMENYVYCKKFWGYVQTQRRREGKFPLLPPVDERDAVKQHYLAEFKKSI